MRGNHSRIHVLHTVDRTIPACAGEPSQGVNRATRAKDYPRVCGGTKLTPNPARLTYGLSPRVRGNPCQAWKILCQFGTIPACAGEPGTDCMISLRTRDYPRVCGGTYVLGLLVLAVSGLSPRVRGNLSYISELKDIKRTIPACAGEPILYFGKFQSSQDYPRVCGGTSSTWVLSPTLVGLSPRVRGNHCRLEC